MTRMKLAAVLASVALLVGGCGGDEEEAPAQKAGEQEMTEPSYDKAEDKQATTQPSQDKPEGVQEAASSGDGEAAGKQAATEFGCTGCHAAQSQLVGPPLVKVAEKYNGDQDKILSTIKEVTKNGSQGKWSELTGGMSMPPQPQAADQTEKLKAIAGWIAGMAE